MPSPFDALPEIPGNGETPSVKLKPRKKEAPEKAEPPPAARKRVKAPPPKFELAAGPLGSVEVNEILRSASRALRRSAWHLQAAIFRQNQFQVDYYHCEVSNTLKAIDRILFKINLETAKNAGEGVSHES